MNNNENKIKPTRKKSSRKKIIPVESTSNELLIYRIPSNEDMIGTDIRPIFSVWPSCKLINAGYNIEYDNCMKYMKDLKLTELFNAVKNNLLDIYGVRNQINNELSLYNLLRNYFDHDNYSKIFISIWEVLRIFSVADNPADYMILLVNDNRHNDIQTVITDYRNKIIGSKTDTYFSINNSASNNISASDGMVSDNNSKNKSKGKRKSKSGGNIDSDSEKNDENEIKGGDESDSESKNVNKSKSKNKGKKMNNSQINALKNIDLVIINNPHLFDKYDYLSEQHYVKFLFENLSQILPMIKNGSNLVIKIYGTYMLITIKLISLLSTLFTNTYLYKPQISNHQFDNTHFLVCVNFKENLIDSEILNVLGSVSISNLFINNIYTNYIYPDLEIFSRINTNNSIKTYEIIKQIDSYIHDIEKRSDIINYVIANQKTYAAKWANLFLNDSKINI